MCNCLTWCRTFDTPNELKYGVSDHHQNCEDFKLVKFYSVNYDDNWCIVETESEAKDIVEDDISCTISEVFMTRDQFERLQEFEGF